MKQEVKSQDPEYDQSQERPESDQETCEHEVSVVAYQISCISYGGLLLIIFVYAICPIRLVIAYLSTGEESCSRELEHLMPLIVCLLE